MVQKVLGVTPIVRRSILVVDGQALVMALGRPDYNTFDDLWYKFVKALLPLVRTLIE